MQIIEGNMRATGKKFAIVVSRFNSFVVESLLEEYTRCPLTAR